MTLTQKERQTLHDFVRLKSINKVAEERGLTKCCVKHRLSSIYQKLRDRCDIGDGSPCMELVEYVIREELEP